MTIFSKKLISLVLLAAACGGSTEPAVELASEPAGLDGKADTLATSGLAKDPRFIQLLQGSATVIGQQLAYGRKASAQAWRDNVAALRSGNEAQAQAALAQLGVDRAIIAEHGALVRDLVAKYRLTTPLAIKSAFRSAYRTAGGDGFVGGAIEYELHQIEDEDYTAPTDAESSCLNDCKIDAALEAEAAFVAYCLSLAGCGAAGPAWPICAGLATATYVAALAAMDAHVDNCVEACEGVESYCSQDSDCPAGDFCWTGVLGIGHNECRDKKELGQTCSRGGQCESGCCKYNLFENAVSPVCRPSDKCN